MQEHSGHSNNAAIDRYNRRIDYLRISITDKCNLQCVYCMPSKKMRPFQKDDILTYEEIIRFVRIAAGHGLRKVRITGGEPLIRKNLTWLISEIRKIGVPEISVTTNGILLSSLASDLKEAGLDRVNISLDTMNPDRYRGMTRGGRISDVLDAVKAAEKADLTPIKINVVPIRGLNDDEITDFASLTYEKDYHIRFIEFMPASCSGIWKREKCVSAMEILGMISRLGELEQMKFRGMGPSRNYRLKGAKGIIGVISPISDHFCSHCNRLRLTADGRIRPCLFSNNTIDIKTPMRNGATDSELHALYSQAVISKPQRHRINQDKGVTRIISSMSRIGG